MGGKEEISIDDLAYSVKETLRSSSPIVYVPYAEAYGEEFEDMQRRVPDIGELTRLTGFVAKHGLHDIIVDVAEYQRQRLADRRRNEQD